MSPTERILRGPLAFEVARFGLPLALGMGLQTTFNLVDAYLIARLPVREVGPAMGALGIANLIAAVGTISSYGITTGAGAMLARRAGAGDEAGVRKVAWQSTLVVAALGVAFAVLGLLFAGPVVRGLVGAKGDVALYAERYLQISVGGSFTIFFLLHLSTLQRALGSAKTPVALLVFGNVLNVLLAVLLIFGPGPAPAGLGWAAELARALGVPRLGMLGAAWATVIARALVLVPNVIIVIRRFGLGVPATQERGPDAAVLRELFRLALPLSAQFLVRIGSMLLASSLVARYFTTETDQTASVAMGLVFRLDTLALFVAIGWGNAAQTFVGQCLGANLHPRAVRSGWLSAGYDLVTAAVIALLALRYGSELLSLFDPEPGPLTIASQYLSVVAPAYLGLGTAIVLGAAISGAGATRLALSVNLFVLLAVQTPLSIVVCARGGSLRALFACVAASHVLGAVIYAAVFARRRWLGAPMSAPSSSPLG